MLCDCSNTRLSSAASNVFAHCSPPTTCRRLYTEMVVDQTILHTPFLDKFLWCVTISWGASKRTAAVDDDDGAAAAAAAAFYIAVPRVACNL